MVRTWKSGVPRQGWLALFLAFLPGLAAGEGYIGMGTGYAGLRPDDQDLVQLSGEYWGPSPWWLLRPFAGLGMDELGDGAFFAGALLDYPLGGRWFLVPSFGPTLYWHNGGFDLGLPLEFRSGLELAYSRRNGQRFGLGVYHVSNANLGDRNPGVEMFALWWRFPIP